MISVIIPAYNSEKYLERCLDSVLNQTYKDLQIIVVDDGSTDNSGQILDDYAMKDSRVEVIHIENGGVSNARNTGIERAKGEYIAFVDSDDAIKENMYEELLQVIENTNVDIVSSDLLMDDKLVKHNIEADRIYQKEDIEKEILHLFTKNNSIALMAFYNKLIRAKVLKDNNVRFYVGFSYQEDLMFMINVLANAESLYYLPKAYYQYFPMPTGLYSSYRQNSGEKFIESRRKIIELIEKYQIQNIDWAHFHNTYLYNICYFVYRTSQRIKDKKLRKELIYNALSSKELYDTCVYLSSVTSSFDARIVKAIIKKKYGKALCLIKFVHSGKATKLQKFIAKLRGQK